MHLGTFKNNLATLPLDLVLVSTNKLPLKRAVRCFKTGMLRPIHLLERRSTVEGEDKDSKIRWSNRVRVSKAENL